MNFNHPLCQNDKQWEGYTVFRLDFNGSQVEFVTLVDAENVLRKARNSPQGEVCDSAEKRSPDGEHNNKRVQSLCETCFVINCNRQTVKPVVVKCTSYSCLRSGTKPVL